MREKCIAQLSHVRIPETLLNMVTLIAEREDRTPSWIVRTAVQAYCDKYMAQMVDEFDAEDKQSCAHQCAADKSQGCVGEV